MISYRKRLLVSIGVLLVLITVFYVGKKTLSMTKDTPIIVNYNVNRLKLGYTKELLEKYENNVILQSAGIDVPMDLALGKYKNKEELFRLIKKDYNNTLKSLKNYEKLRANSSGYDGMYTPEMILASNDFKLVYSVSSDGLKGMLSSYYKNDYQEKQSFYSFSEEFKKDSIIKYFEGLGD